MPDRTDHPSQILDGLRRSVAQDRETSCFDKPVVVALLDIAEAANAFVALSDHFAELGVFDGESWRDTKNAVRSALASLTGAGE